MRSLFDFSSWQGVLSTLLGLVLVTVIAVGIRLVVMQRVQQRRERQNRQINERLKTLIAAYRTLGGSFTGNLAVDPSHLRDIRTRTAVAPENSEGEAMLEWGGSERSRHIRDTVEAALSDVVLLGTAEQVRLAAQAASDMVAGRKIETSQLVRSLRDFIREVLDLESVPADLEIPGQGPLRSSAAGGAATWRGRVVERGVAAVRVVPAWPPAACWAWGRAGRRRMPMRFQGRTHGSRRPGTRSIPPAIVRSGLVASRLAWRMRRLCCGG